MRHELNLSENLEDYLKTILMLEKQNRVARAKDIAEQLQVQRGSVTGVLKTLSEKGLINYAPYGFITLTEQGTKVALEMIRRYEILKSFLFDILHVDGNTAEATACRMEHRIDKKSMKRLSGLVDYVFTSPGAGQKWIESFLDYCTTDHISSKR